MTDMEVKFEDYSVQVDSAMESAISRFLTEASAELASQAARNTRVSTGDTKGAWDYEVNEAEKAATIGNPLQNAIWEEFGTGEYAVNGDGRKGGWYIHESKLDAKAKSKMKKVIGKGGEVFYYTKGKLPTHALQRAFDSKKEAIKKHGAEVLHAEFGDD